MDYLTYKVINLLFCKRCETSNSHLLYNKFLWSVTSPSIHYASSQVEIFSSTNT